VIIVTGEITARPDSLDELRALCIAHSVRSRAEAGCVSHDAYIDAANPLRIFFFERWADRAALKAHFAVPASNDFMRAVRGLAADSKGPEIVETA
jgi:quinol monooxygenase YgiN